MTVTRSVLLSKKNYGLWDARHFLCKGQGGKLQILRFLSLTVVMFVACGGARAKCVGGGQMKGSFGTILSGPINGSSTAENYGGLLVADGKCNITGSLTGGVYGQSSATQSITGTYAVPADKQGTLNLSFGGATPILFEVGLEKDGNASEVTGIAVSGSSAATLKMTAIAPRTYTVSSLSGTYIATCTGASNAQSPPNGFGVELAYSVFDGAGNVTAIALVNNNGTPASATVSGTYIVNANGSFTIQDSGAYARYSVVGAIVNNSTETRSVLVDMTSGFGAYRTCVGKRQS